MDKFPKEENDTFPLSKKNRFEQSKEEKIMKEEQPKIEEGPEPPEEGKKVSLRFKYNRKFELRIGRNTIPFLGPEERIVDESIIYHPDFTEEISKYFVVKEIE